MADEPVDFVAQSTHLSVEEYRRRRDRTTAQQLKLLQQSPEFARHYAPRRGSLFQWKRALFLFLLTSAGLFLLRNQTGLQQWLPGIEDQAAAAFDRLARLAAPAVNRISSGAHVHPPNCTAASREADVQHLSAALRRQEKEIGSLTAKLDTVTAEREQLKSASSAIMQEAEYQQRAMAKLTQQLHQFEARHQQGEASKHTPKSSSREAKSLDEDDASGALLLSTVVALVSLTATILYAKALRSAKRQLREASQAKLLAQQYEEEVAAVRMCLRNMEAEAESNTQELTVTKKQVGELARMLEEAAASEARALEEEEIAAAERDALAAEKVKLEEELAQLKMLVEQLAQASQEDSVTSPPGLAGNKTTNFFSATPSLQQNGQGQVADGPASSLAVHGSVKDYKAVGTPLAGEAAASSAQNGRSDWPALSDRVSDLRSQLSLVRSKGAGLVGPPAGSDGASVTSRPLLGSDRSRELEQDVRVLKSQNEILEAQLDQVTASLADFVNNKAKAEARSRAQSQDMDDMAMLLGRREDDNSQLQREVLALKDVSFRLLRWLESQEQPPEEHLQEVHETLDSLEDHKPASPPF